MRETCARVLAAALMTGAIAGTVGMSALFGPTSEADRPITAPPSSLQRFVRAEVLRGAPAHRAKVERRVVTHSLRTTRARPRPATHRLVIIRTHRVHAVPRRLATTKPKPQPVAQAPAVQAAPTPEAASPAPPTPPVEEAESDHDHGNGNGNAYGHEKDHGHGHEGGHKD
jgi:type IV secretory pathway VirB10-like protein